MKTLFLFVIVAMITACGKESVQETSAQSTTRSATGVAVSAGSTSGIAKVPSANPPPQSVWCSLPHCGAQHGSYCKFFRYKYGESNYYFLKHNNNMNGPVFGSFSCKIVAQAGVAVAPKTKKKPKKNGLVPY